MPKICIIIDTLKFGGAERQVVTTANAMEGNVSVAVLRSGSELTQELSIPNYDFSYCKTHLLRLFSLTKFLRKERPDIVHCHMIYANTIGSIAARLAGVPVVIIQEHGLGKWKRWQHLMMDRLSFLLCNQLITVSNANLHNKKRKLWGNLNKIITIYNCVNEDLFGAIDEDTNRLIRQRMNIEKSDVVIGYIGRMVPVKALEDLLDVFQEIIFHHPNLKLLLIGDGPTKGDLEERVKSYGIIKSIIFTGFRRDIPELLSIFDIAVNVSKMEDLCIALLEATLCGKPIVASDVGGTREIVVNGKNGFLFPAGHKKQLKEKLLKLVVSSELRRNMGNASRELFLDRFSLQNHIHTLSALYEKCLTKK